MMRRPVAILAVAAAAASVAITAWVLVRLAADRDQPLHSWYVHVTPADGETHVMRIDMRWTEERIRREFHAALDPLFTQSPQDFDGETVVGTFECRWSSESHWSNMPAGVRTATTISFGGSPVAGYPGQFPWVVMGTLDGQPGPIMSNISAKGLQSMICKRWVDLMMSEYDLQMNRGIPVPSATGPS